jgi:hypothetical protein
VNLARPNAALRNAALARPNAASYPNAGQATAGRHRPIAAPARPNAASCLRAAQRRCRIRPKAAGHFSAPAKATARQNAARSLHASGVTAAAGPKAARFSGPHPIGTRVLANRPYASRR